MTHRIENLGKALGIILAADCAELFMHADRDKAINMLESYGSAL